MAFETWLSQNPGNNNFDRYLIQDIVKEYARRYPLCIFESSREELKDMNENEKKIHL